MTRPKDLLLALNHSLLFLCVSMYLGTGWSLLLFSFPIAPELTVDTYYLQFVPQVTAATKFFTWMTALMLALCVVMAVAEWRTRLRWVPVVVFLGVVAATGLTMWKIIPLNKEMAGHIRDPARLGEVLGQWMTLNRIRVGLWTVQWAAMMYYFARKYLDAATPALPPAAVGPTGVAGRVAGAVT
jgi:hypothetical protein